MEFTGLFFGGLFTLEASSEEETVSEEDDGGGCDFVCLGLVVGGTLEAAGVEEGVILFAV